VCQHGGGVPMTPNWPGSQPTQRALGPRLVATLVQLGLVLELARRVPSRGSGDSTRTAGLPHYSPSRGSGSGPCSSRISATYTLYRMLLGAKFPPQAAQLELLAKRTRATQTLVSERPVFSSTTCKTSLGLETCSVSSSATRCLVHTTSSITTQPTTGSLSSRVVVGSCSCPLCTGILLSS
jgi:hypothetical protein